MPLDEAHDQWHGGELTMPATMSVQSKTIDEILASFTAGPNPKLPGTVLVAVDASGRTLYKGHNGFRSIDPASPHVTEQFTPDTLVWIASVTKPMTTIAALQCVDKGLIALDDEVATLLPELKDPDILLGFTDNDVPILKKALTPITLRILLSHTSGFIYIGENPLFQKYDKFIGFKRDRRSAAMRDYVQPLAFEPGKGQAYGPGVDWAGLLIARLTGETLELYMSKHIWEPLGMKSSTFHPENRPDLDQHLPTHFRTPDGGLEMRPFPRTRPAVDDLGGEGVFSTANDISKLLVGILSTSTAEPHVRNTPLGIPSSLLSEIFGNQLGGSDTAAHKSFDSRRAQMVSNLPVDVPITWGFSAVVTCEDVEGMRRKGSGQWGGLPNIRWWIDPKSGIAGLMFTQLLPTDDPKGDELFAAFEKEVYRLAETL